MDHLEEVDYSIVLTSLTVFFMQIPPIFKQTPLITISGKGHFDPHLKLQCD